MPINEDFANRQVRRLTSLDFFPKEPEAVLAIVEMLMLARDEECCKRVVQSFVDDARECPKPADIRRCMLIENQRHDERLAVEQNKPKCPECKGTQYVISWWLVTHEVIRDTDGTAVSGFTRKERIPDEDTARKLRKSIDEKKQQVVSAAGMCRCHAAYEPPRLRPGTVPGYARSEVM